MYDILIPCLTFRPDFSPGIDWLLWIRTYFELPKAENAIREIANWCKPVKKVLES